MSRRNPVLPEDQLFVPMTTQMYRNFEAGTKTWEVRRLGKRWQLDKIRVGRRVEIRRGYTRGQSLQGTILQVLQVDSVADLFDKVPFQQVLPMASCLLAARLLALVEFFQDATVNDWNRPINLVAFEIALDKRA